MIGNSRASRIIASLLTIVLLLTTVTFTAGWYEPSAVTAAGEKTSDFLPSDTTAYFSFNLLPGGTQSIQFNYFLSFFKADILAAVSDISSLAADYLDDNNWASIVGPELAVATYDISGNPGVVFFVQVPSGQVAQDIQDLVIYAMDSVLGGKQSETLVGGGVTEVNRLISSETRLEYYTNAVVSGSGDRYVLGSIGNITLADFQTLTTSVTNGAWAGSSLGSNADFQDVQSNLAAARVGLGYLSAGDLQNDIIDLSAPLGPYLIELEGTIPYLSMLEGVFAIVSSPSFDLVEPYIPAYAGISISGMPYALSLDYYSPDDSLPFGAGIANLMSTAGFVSEDALEYYTDVNINGWWQNLRPMIEANPGEWEALCDDLSAVGLGGVFGFDVDMLCDVSMDPLMDANQFSWSTGEFALAHLPYSGNEGHLFIFSVADYAQAVANLGDLTTALGNAGVSGVETRFTAGNSCLLVGWPSGVIADMLSNRKLTSHSNFSTMKSLLLSPLRGMFYKGADSPLLDIGASYFIGSAEGRIIFRLPTPYSSQGGAGGGGRAGAGTDNWEICVLGRCDSGEVNNLGKTLESIWVASPDKQVIVYINKYTKMMDADGNRLDGIEVNLCDFVPDPPSGYKVLAAYCFTPSGATFDPAIRVNIKFNPGEIDPGQTVVAAYYNEAAGQWQFVDGIIIAGGQAAFNIEHFTVYGLLTPEVSATPTPAPTSAPTPPPSGGLKAGTWALIGVALWIILTVIVFFVLRKMRGRKPKAKAS